MLTIKNLVSILGLPAILRLSPGLHVPIPHGFIGTMAKKNRQVKQYEAEPAKPHVTTKVQIIQPETPSTYYSNFIEVSHTEYEFALSFAKLPTKLRPQQLLDVKSGEPLLLEPLLQVEVPTRLIPGLVRALMLQVEIYEKRYGAIPGSGQKNGGQSTNGKTK